MNSQKRVEFGGLSPTAPAFHLAEHRVKSQKLMVLLTRSDLARAGARVELEMMVSSPDPELDQRVNLILSKTKE